MARLAAAMVLVLLLAVPLMGAVNTQPKASTAPYCTSSVIPQYASWYCSVADQAIANYWVQWEPVAILAVFMAFGISAVLFAAGTLTQSSRVRNFAIGEFYEATASTIIVIGFLFMSAVVIGLIPSLVVGNGNPYLNALGYINTTATATQGLVTQLTETNMASRIYASTNLEICTVIYPGPGGKECINTNGAFAWPAMFFYALPATALANIQTEGLAILYGEFYLIMLAMYAAIPVFLIPGVIFRAILPLRALGGFMVAIAFGLFIVMPLLFSVASYFTNTQLQSQIQYTTAQISNYNGPNTVQNAISQQSPLVMVLGQVQNSLGAYWMSVLFYPALIFSLTYVSIEQIGNFIGGMTKMSSKIKII